MAILAIMDLKWANPAHAEFAMSPVDMAAGAFAEKASGTKQARRSVQDWRALPSYFTQELWNVLGSSAPADAKLEAMLSFGLRGGLRLPSEPTVKLLNSVWLIAMEGVRVDLVDAATKLLYLSHVKASFQAMRRRADEPVGWLGTLPASPFTLQTQSATHWTHWFGHSAPAAMPEGFLAALKHVDASYGCRATTSAKAVNTQNLASDLQFVLSTFLGQQHSLPPPLSGRVVSRGSTPMCLRRFGSQQALPIEDISPRTLQIEPNAASLPANPQAAALLTARSAAAPAAPPRAAIAPAALPSAAVGLTSSPSFCVTPQAPMIAAVEPASSPRTTADHAYAGRQHSAPEAATGAPDALGSITQMLNMLSSRKKRKAGKVDADEVEEAPLKKSTSSQKVAAADASEEVPQKQSSSKKKGKAGKAAKKQHPEAAKAPPKPQPEAVKASPPLPVTKSRKQEREPERKPTPQVTKSRKQEREPVQKPAPQAQQTPQLKGAGKSTHKRVDESKHSRTPKGAGKSSHVHTFGCSKCRWRWGCAKCLNPATKCIRFSIFA